MVVNGEWTVTIEKDLVMLSGPALLGLRSWNRGWKVMSCELAQARCRGRRDEANTVLWSF